MNFNIQTAAMFVFFVFDKNGLIKSCSSFEDISVNNISWSHVDWCKFCIHLKSLKDSHFGMVEGTGLKVWRRGHLQWHDLSTEFHKKLPIGSKVIREDTQIDRRTDRQTGDLISLTFLFKESRLKNQCSVILSGDKLRKCPVSATVINFRSLPIPGNPPLLYPNPFYYNSETSFKYITR
jgi:hypothetical protein